MTAGILSPDQICTRANRAELTLTEMCRGAGIAPSTLGRWRAGKIDIRLATYASIVRTIEEAEAQVSRRRRRLKQSAAKFRASLAAEGNAFRAPLSAAGASGDV